MNITKQKSQKTFDKQAADYDTNIQGGNMLENSISRL